MGDINKDHIVKDVEQCRYTEGQRGGQEERYCNKPIKSQQGGIKSAEGRKEMKGISQEEHPALGDCGDMESRDKLLLNNQGRSFSNGGAN